MTVQRWILQMVAVVVPRVRSNLAVDAADVRRDRREWAEAASYYRRALRICPDRRPIWVQLGHMLRENEQPEAAFDAYQRACALPGDDGDAPLHLGLMARRLGRFAEAKSALRLARRLTPGQQLPGAALLELLHDPLAVDGRARQAADTLMAAETARLELESPEGCAAVVFDVCDLVSHFRHSRLPTGIQRVQIEVICAALDAFPRLQVGCFSEADGGWQVLPLAHFERLCALSLAGADRLEPAWIDAIETLTAALARRVLVSFAPGAVLVNLGTSWWLQNYFLHVRHAQQTCGIHYVPFVHDLIPALVPEHCLHELTRDYLSWAFQVFDHADFFLANSQSTKTDLQRVAHMLGHAIAPAQVAVVPLNADFRRPGLNATVDTDLTRWGVKPGRYALLVSTIESRKNHVLAFQAWRNLLTRHGADAVPDLVCVGSPGWLNDHVHAALDHDPALAAKVRMLSHLPDDHLALLYRHCLFTLYPSLYEGWGLPITESLCYGKVPVVCRISAMPEAGGDFALYFEPDDLAGLCDAVTRLTFDDDARVALEQHIRDDFKPRNWRDLADQIRDELGRFLAIVRDRPRVGDPASIDANRLYRFARNRRTRLAPIFDNGERFRNGTGWWQPEDWGCATRPGGGELTFALPTGVESVRCWLRLREPNLRAGEATIHSGDRMFRCELTAGQCRWISFVAEPVEGVVRLVIHSRHYIDQSIESRFQDRRLVGAGLSGLIVAVDRQADKLRDIALALSDGEGDAFEFLGTIYPVLLNRDVTDSDLRDYLPPLHSDEMRRVDVIDRLTRSADYALATENSLVFD